MFWRSLQRGHSALGTVGGVISPEMEIPKIMWLASHKPACTRGKLFDLADYLTWRASGVNTRSLCTLVCKWNLDADSNGARWNDDFLASVGLKDLRAQCDIGSEFKAPGSELGTLTQQASSDLGLSTSVKVGVGIIDAHAGGIGCVGVCWQRAERSAFGTRSVACTAVFDHNVIAESRICVANEYDLPRLHLIIYRHQRY